MLAVSAKLPARPKKSQHGPGNCPAQGRRRRNPPARLRARCGAGQGGSGQAIAYRIMRRGKAGEPFFDEATETAPIMPGDVILIGR